MLTKTQRAIKIGPRNHGRRMSLAAFEFAKTEEGYLYELSRGIITVSEVANFYHACVVALVRDFLVAHRLAHPDVIKLILTGMDCKLLIPEWESERHPDIAVYLTMPKGPKNRTMWRTWIPATRRRGGFGTLHRSRLRRQACKNTGRSASRNTGSSIRNGSRWSFCGAANRTGSRNVSVRTAFAPPSCCRDSS